MLTIDELRAVPLFSELSTGGGAASSRPMWRRCMATIT
jgi:hypothetical protein